MAASDSHVMLLTGCASGIGRRLSEDFASAGHRLMLTDVNLEALDAWTQPHGWPSTQVVCRQLDVREPAAWIEAIADLIQRWGRIDVLVNAAGIILPGWAHETSVSAVDRHIDINTKGVIHGTRAAAVEMIKQRSGHIINLGSMAAIAPVPGIALYTASKFAVRGFSLAVAHELRPHGVYVTLICPDAVATPMVDLQRNYPEAALTFSGPQILSVDDVSRAIQRALIKRPLEMTIPASRGWLAKLASAWPNLATRLLPGLTRRGLASQEKQKTQIS